VEAPVFLVKTSPISRAPSPLASWIVTADARWATAPRMPSPPPPLLPLRPPRMEALATAEEGGI